MTSRFDQALERIDAANSADPRTVVHEGRAVPRELLFSTQVYAWVERLVEQPSEPLRLAARGHTIRRWQIPRREYDMDNIGYHQWRQALTRFHADETAGILREVGYDDQTITRVTELILKVRWRDDPEGQALEDGDCLAFLELKLSDYLDTWDEPKMISILQGTLRKMSPAAIAHAGRLPLSPREKDLLARAAS